ncbi:MAG: hypothetical protein ABI675_19410 [Chitinophagaceae bacterium]
MKKEQFYNIVTGQTPAYLFVGFIFFAVIGIALSLLWQTNKRDVSSPHTPEKFSFWFMMRDNAKRLSATILTVYIALRFTPEIFNVQLTNFWSLCIGLGLDKIAEIVKSKTSLLDVKPNANNP